MPSRDGDDHHRDRHEVKSHGRGRDRTVDRTHGDHDEQVDHHVVDEAVDGLGKQYLLAVHGEAQQQLVVAAEIKVLDHVAYRDDGGHAHRECHCNHEEFKGHVRTPHEHRREEVNSRDEDRVDRKRENDAQRLARLILGGGVHAGPEARPHFQPDERSHALHGDLVVHCSSSVDAGASSTGMSGRISACSCAT